MLASDVLTDLLELRACCDGSPNDRARVDGVAEKYRKLAEAEKDQQDAPAESAAPATVTVKPTAPATSLRPKA